MLTIALVIGMLAAGIGLLALHIPRSPQRAPRRDVASTQRSLDDAEQLVDLIFASAARRMEQLSQRAKNTDWEAW